MHKGTVWKLCSYTINSILMCIFFFFALYRRQNEAHRPVRPVLLCTDNSSTLYGTRCKSRVEKTVCSTIKILQLDIKYCERNKPVESSTFRLTSSTSSPRLSSWLGSRRKRALDTPSVGTTEESENFVRPEDIRDTLLPHSRWEPIRKHFNKSMNAKQRTSASQQGDTLV